MTNRDTAHLIQASDVAASIGLLTRLPVRVDGAAAAARGAAAAWAYPLVGLLVGLLGGAVGFLMLLLELPNSLAAGLMLATTVIIAGAMHEDGLADCADGFWGGWDPARRLEIMKDSHIGAYGVLALVFSLMLRWAAVAPLLAAGWVMLALVIPAVVSRAAMVAVMYALQNARATGLSHGVGRPRIAVVGIAAAIALVISIAVIGAASIAVGAVAIIATLACMAVAKAKIGGQTGDVLGATQQVVEIAVLATLVALF